MARLSVRQPKIKPPITRDILKVTKKTAWRPFNNLAQRGVPPRAIAIFMLKLVVGQMAKNRTDWDEPKAMKMYTLKRFPGRILQMARDIEALNSDPILNPGRRLVPMEERHTTARNLMREMSDKNLLNRKRSAHEFAELNTRTKQTKTHWREL
jgi:hypothetical protein